LKILGIEDNLDINKLLDTVLNGSGHEFRYVSSGRDGLKLIHKQKFDLVLLDISMPEFSGFDVIDSLRKSSDIKKQRIVIFTASSITDSEINELTKGAVFFCIRKPIDMNILLEKIEEAALI